MSMDTICIQPIIENYFVFIMCNYSVYMVYIECNTCANIVYDDFY